MDRQQRNLAVLGAAATMAGAAAAYLYIGKGAPARRKKVATWYKAAEKEIVTEASKLKNAAFNEENYQRIIDVVAKRYEQVRKLSPEEVAQFIAVMREGWERAGKAIGAATATRGTQKAATRTVKKKVRKAKTSRKTSSSS